MKLSKGKQEIADFCDKHNACKEGREWAMTRKNMHDVWLHAKYDWMLWILSKNVLGDIDSRLFACWCARNTPCGGGKTTWDMMPDDACRNAVVTAERYAIGDATKEELSSAGASARASAGSRESASASAGASAWASAGSSASASARASAWARESAGRVQLKHLRKTYSPFKRKA